MLYFFMSKDSYRAALFLDRDGVIIKDHGYVGKISDVDIIEEIIPTLQWITAQNIPIVVLTNQSGVARGYYSLAECDLVHQHITKLLEKRDISIKQWFICPHHATAGVGELKVDCQCRKPHAGMALLAQEELQINFSKSLMIGDKKSDILEIKELKTVLLQGHYSLDNIPSNVTLTTHKKLLPLLQRFF